MTKEKNMDEQDRQDFNQVVTLFARELTKAGLNVDIRDIEEAEEDGCYVILATWSIGRPEIAIWFDKWLGMNERHFWFGFQGAKGEVAKLLKDLAVEDFAMWNHSRFEKNDKEGKREVVVKRHRGLVYERYRGAPSYLGKYDVGFQNALSRPKLVEQATAFLLESIDDADLVEAKRNGATEYETSAIGRIGQREFRRRLEKYWEGRCAVTKRGVAEAVRASHIIPWKVSEELRLDPNNGLLLIATIDALFDQHLISFDHDGNMLFAAIGPEDRKVLALDGKRLSKSPSKKQKAHLKEHNKQAERLWGCKLTR
jgi:hypothetical protein